MRIKTKMLLSILITTSVIYIGTIAIISMHNRAKTLENAVETADAYVREYANGVETSLNEDIATARAMAQAFTGYQNLMPEERDRFYDEFLANILKSNPRYIAVFLQWEIGAIDPEYDKPYGRIRKSGSWKYDGSDRKRKKIRWVIDTLDTQGDDTSGIYYHAKSTGFELITNPYFYSYSQDDALPTYEPIGSDDVLESTIIIPIFNKGKYVGLTGMDLPLNAFQGIIRDIKPFKGSYAFLVANNGSLVAHPMLGKIQLGITEINTIFSEQKMLLSNISAGTENSFTDFDENGNEIYVSIVPVRIGATKTPWAMGIVIPLNLITADAELNFYIATVVGILGLVVLALIIWMISGSITRPIMQTTHVLKGLAKGAVADAMVQPVKTKDEIGEMTASANTLVDFRKTTTVFANQIGSGNLEAEYQMLSDEDELGKALIDMRDNLRASNEQIQEQSLKLLDTNRELEKLSVVASETDNAVIIMDADGKLEWVNDGLKRLYGYTFEEYIAEKGNSFFQVSSNPEVKKLFESCLAEKRAVHYISKNIGRYGNTFWAQTTLTPIISKSGKVTKLIAIDSDITKVIEAEEEISNYAKKLESQRDKLKALNATKDRFFAIIAHDLKNPFGALHSMIETLNESFREIEEDEKVLYIQHIQTITNRIYNLLDNLLLWATAQTGRITFKPEAFELSDLIQDNIRLAKLNAEKKDILIASDIAADLVVKADKNMISTVLRNLISNALKYSNPGGTVNVVASPNGESRGKKFIRVNIVDDGVGIDPDIKEKLFLIDQNPSTLGTADEKGTGLGLIICKEFVEKNGGKIGVDSQVGKGSAFWFTVPATKI